MHPATQQLLNYFDFDHLPGGGVVSMRDVSKRYRDVAHELVREMGDDGGPELTVALRKLLESKDAAVRTALTINQPF